jgi:hypothetical protein
MRTKRAVILALLRGRRPDLANALAHKAVGFRVAPGSKLDVRTLPLREAREYAARVFSQAGQDLDERLPDFDRNYQSLQKILKQARSIKRSDMPVIRQNDIDDFEKALRAGRVDIFEPYAKGHLYTPRGLTPDRGGREWVRLGFQDGDLKDDVLGARLTRVSAKKLLPTQNQIWLEKLIHSIAFFGKPSEGSLKRATIIASQEGYILDGHHRYGQVWLAEPSWKLDTLVVPLPIDLLVRVARTYGNAIGNEQRQ